MVIVFVAQMELFCKTEQHLVKFCFVRAAVLCYILVIQLFNNIELFRTFLCPIVGFGSVIVV